jgi:putative RecB family exonuclease
MAVYSHSKLSTFEQCPYRYKLRYIDKIKPDIDKSIEAHLGTCVHDTLEWIYNQVKENRPTPTIDDAIMFYSHKWQDSFTEDIMIVKKQFTAKDYFNKGVEFILKYFLKHQPFKDGTIECEKKILFNLTEEHKLVGFIDRFVHNLETGEYEVHDYKTANSLPTQQKMDADKQLALYSIAIKEQFGHDKEVTLIWHYLAHDAKIISKRTNEQLAQLKQATIDLIKKIESNTEFPKRKTILCGWCEYQHTCKKAMEHPPEIKQEQPQIEKQEITTNLDNYPTIKKYIRD